MLLVESSVQDRGVTMTETVVRALVRSRDRAEAEGKFGALSLRDCAAEWKIVDYSDHATLEGVARVR